MANFFLERLSIVCQLKKQQNRHEIFLENTLKRTVPEMQQVPLSINHIYLMCGKIKRCLLSVMGFG
ncbi:hypothetical protein NRI_0191 [Neorickettsia risticii str. Illinois]|uniref:Uncharacterized protein n=1 Tax=Neorickettsia risticii (strain Illinois) TaxID=434131 RepID=C6V467_NEORI|nr:hypothetical protein NRI_0191 [Neorickettsia risticii str. Illinois]